MPNVLLEKSGEIAPEGMKRLSQSRNNAQWWIRLVVKVKSDDTGTWNVRSVNQSKLEVVKGDSKSEH